MDEATIVVITTTFPDAAAARGCAERLVGAGLAACVQVDGPLTAVYRWAGAVERAEEWRVTCKVPARCREACLAALVDLHPYEVPQLLWHESRASAAYVAWAEGATGTPPQAPDASGAVFDVALHPLPDGAAAGAGFRDGRGTWPTIVLGVTGERTFAVGFDEALARVDALGRAFVEPDGSFVWVGAEGDARWQVDGNAWERDGAVVRVDVRGRCPVADLRRFLDVWRGPGERVAVELVRAGVWLDEPTFLRHAVAPDGATAADRRR